MTASCAEQAVPLHAGDTASAVTRLRKAERLLSAAREGSRQHGLSINAAFELANVYVSMGMQQVHCSAGCGAFPGERFAQPAQKVSCGVS